MTDPRAWDAEFPHEVYPAPYPEDVFCDCLHIRMEHIVDLRLGTFRCDERDGMGKRKCKCREFVCYEHPDGRCLEGILDD